MAIYDPQVSEQQMMLDLQSANPTKDVKDSVTVYQDATSACVDACAIAIMTEWDHFKTDHIPLPIEKPVMLQKKPSIPIETEDSSDNSEHSSSSASSDAGSAAESETLRDCSSFSPISAPDSDAQELGHKKPQSERADWHRIAGVMRRPRLVFDGRNVVDPQRLAGLGFRVECIGKAGARQARW